MSLHLLALDTTSEFGSIALSAGDRVIEEVAIESPEGFGHILFDEILGLLSRHQLHLNQLDGFASAAGPGSFTGVRVGLTAVKGLAEANAKKVVAVSNLQALACFGSRPLRATVVDARRGEIYGAVFDADWNLVQDEVVMQFEQWLERLPTGDLELITGGFDIPAQSRAALKAPLMQAPRVLAGSIARIAARQFAMGLARDPAAVDANYVRRSDAELFWRDPLIRA